MNTKLLKQKILDLAIRGKLTQQLKTDGTAADLLKEISSACHSGAKRSGAIESKKSKDLKPIIPLDKNEAPFEIPENWEWVRLGDIVSKITDGTHHSPVNTEKGDFLYVTAKNIKDNGIALDNVTYVSADIHNEIFARCNPEKGDVLLIKDGATTGIVTVNGLETPFSLLSSVALIKPGVFIESWFLAFVIRSNLFNQMIRNQMKGVGITRITLKQIENFILPLPPLAEQQRIVAKIEEAFAEIDAIEKNKELLKTHIKQTRQKILDLAIHGKLVPQNKSDEPASVLLERITRDNPHYEKLTDFPFEIPDSWEWANAEDLFNIRSAIRIHQTDWQKEGIPFFRGRELVQLCKTGNVDFEIYLSEKLYEENKRKGGVPQQNDILVSAVGTLGFAYVVKGDKPFYYKDAYILCFENQHNLNPFYFQHLIHSKFINKIIYDGSKGTTVDQLTIENAKQLPFPLPPLAEQKRIVDKIEEIFASLDEISLHLV